MTAQINPDPDFWFKEVTVKLDVLTLMAVHGNLLLALRHPHNTGESRDRVVQFVKGIGDELVLLGAMTPGQLKEAYRLEAEGGNAEFLEELEETAPLSARTSVSGMDPEMLHRDAKCCACGDPMDSSYNVNVLMIHKKAKWKNPIWDNLLLKPGIERIQRALAVVCDDCKDNGTQPVEAIEITGDKILYHKVTELEDAFEITPDMVARNIKDLRG